MAKRFLTTADFLAGFQLEGVDGLPGQSVFRTTNGLSWRHPGSELVVFDDFRGPDRLLQGSTTPSGHVWVLSGSGASTTTITSNAYVSQQNTYAALDPGSAFTRMDAAFRLDEQSGGQNNRSVTCLTLIVDNALLGLGTMLHWIIGPNGWTFQKRVSGGAITGVASGEHYLISGAAYSAGIEKLSSGSVRLHCPDGSIVDVTDSDFNSMTWRYPCWQNGYNPDAYRAFFLACSVGPQTQKGMSALNKAADIASLTYLTKGPLILNRRVHTYAFPSAAGWYRIASESAITTFEMHGTITFSAVEQYQSSHSIIRVSAFYNAVSALVKEYSWTPGIFTQARLSADSSTLKIYLDLYKNIDRKATCVFEFLGVMTPVSSPIANATAGATASQTLTL